MIYIDELSVFSALQIPFSSRLPADQLSLIAFQTSTLDESFPDSSDFPYSLFTGVGNSKKQCVYTTHIEFKMTIMTVYKVLNFSFGIQSLQHRFNQSLLRSNLSL